MLRLSWLHKESANVLLLSLGSSLSFCFQAARHVKYRSHLKRRQVLQVAMPQVARFLKAPGGKLMHRIPFLVVLQPFGGSASYDI